ncbi:MAG TPA: CbtB-domain containing protein [Casimicrobiaceae bacterium]|jgi:cobalt transporter subunit CbtB|nr:CbtB-domain containing protein [Casimicrobiaceae bacterium]
MPSISPALPLPCGDRRVRPTWRAAIGAILLGAVLVFIAGFAQTGAIHNGAHDARHGAALPCH